MSRSSRFSKVVLLVLAFVMVFSVMAFAQDKAPAEQEQRDVEKVLAKVGDTEIKVKDVDAVIAQLPPQQSFMFNTDYGRKRILTELVNKELFYFWAEDNKIAERDDFKSDMENIRKNLMSNYAMKEVMKDISVSEEEVAKYYEEHKAEFVEPEQVKASHILVASEDQAIEILALLEGKKMTFEEAAKEYSSCPSKEKGGELGFFAKGQMVPEFEKAAFALEAGKISEPVKTEYGWHIIMVSEKKAEKQKELAGVKDQIQQNVLGEKQGEKYNQTIEALKAAHPVEIMEEAKEPAPEKRTAESGDKAGEAKN